MGDDVALIRVQTPNEECEFAVAQVAGEYKLFGRRNWMGNGFSEWHEQTDIPFKHAEAILTFFKEQSQ